MKYLFSYNKNITNKNYFFIECDKCPPELIELEFRDASSGVGSEFFFENLQKRSA